MSWLSDIGDRAQGAVAGLVGRMPPALLRRLSGGAPIVIDGQELDAEVQFALAMLRVTGQRSLDRLTPAEARDELRRSARIFAGTPTPMGRLAPQTIPTASGSIPARLYVPQGPDRRRPLVVYYHGGGWVVGGLDTHDTTCRFLAHEIDAAVLAVDYRLAPEARFPAAVDDAVAAFAWASQAAASLGCDPERVAVAGDSAGGNLAAVVAIADGPRPAAQLLVYPVTDLSTKHPSYRTFSTGFFLTEAEMDWYRGHYLPDEAAARDPRASPLLAADLSGAAPAVVVTAGFDVLRDEGEAYAQRLREAGVRVEHRRVAGQIHGFANATGVSPVARDAMREVAGPLRVMLG